MSKKGKKAKDLEMTKEQAEDIFVRFFLNMPPESFTNLYDFSIQLENAFYFFLTFHKHDTTTDLKSSVYTSLAKNFFNFIPQLKQLLNANSHLIEDINSSRSSISNQAISCGCVCYDSNLTHVLVVHHAALIQMYSFPKGKMAEGESFIATAARETLEETGVDVSPYITDQFMFKYPRKGKSDVIMFHVKGVSFDPSKKILISPSPLEIGKVRWIPIDSIGKEGKYFPDVPTEAYIIPRVQQFVKEQLGKK